MSKELIKQKKEIEVIPAAFMDHHTVALRIAVNNTDVKRGRGRWKMDPMLMHDENIKRIRYEWMGG
jgi:hypothetical protein